LLHRITADLERNLYGNPHSDSVPSLHTSKCVESVRLKALHFFKADPKDFDIIFTANATSAIKLLLECLGDYTRSECKNLWYGYHQDSHTSLVGGRELANAHRCFEDDREVDEWVDNGRLSVTDNATLHVLAYPGQSNMTGRRPPSHW
jgi:molybdenum cofactor sulfurtransferase